MGCPCSGRGLRWPRGVREGLWYVCLRERTKRRCAFFLLCLETATQIKRKLLGEGHFRKEVLLGLLCKEANSFGSSMEVQTQRSELKVKL